MSRTNKVNLDLIEEARAVAEQAAKHYGGLAEPDLRLEAQSLRDLGAFQGEPGANDLFYPRLNAFGTEWLRMFDLFIADERAFAQFLEGFAARFAESHKVYRDTELRITKSFNDIAESMDAGGR